LGLANLPFLRLLSDAKEAIEGISFCFSLIEHALGFIQEHNILKEIFSHELILDNFLLDKPNPISKAITYCTNCCNLSGLHRSNELTNAATFCLMSKLASNHPEASESILNADLLIRAVAKCELVLNQVLSKRARSITTTTNSDSDDTDLARSNRQQLMTLY